MQAAAIILLLLGLLSYGLTKLPKFKHHNRHTLRDSKGRFLSARIPEEQAALIVKTVTAKRKLSCARTRKLNVNLR